MHSAESMYFMVRDLLDLLMIRRGTFKKKI